MPPPRIVHAPDGGEWRLERRLSRPHVRPPRWPGRREIDAGTLNLITGVPFDGDLVGWVGFVAAVIAIVVIVIPLVVFGLELLLFGVVASATLLGSVILRPRWFARATNIRTGEVAEREIAGARASAAALEQLAEAIRSGNAPVHGRAPLVESVPPPGWDARE